VAQKAIASSNSYEYPLRPGVAPNPALHPLASLTPSPLTTAELGDGRQALAMLQQVGLL
jgi:iron(III) transport system substrate-binding protein